MRARAGWAAPLLRPCVRVGPRVRLRRRVFGASRRSLAEVLIEHLKFGQTVMSGKRQGEGRETGGV